MLSGKEAIVAVIRAIDQKREITPEGELVVVHYAEDLNKPTSYEDVVRIFKKLQNDEKVLKVIKSPEESEYKSWELKIYKRFDDYHNRLKKTKEYEDYTGEKYTEPETLVVNLDDIVVVDELTLVKEAREAALNQQAEVFNYIKEVIVPQLDFKTPYIAAEAIKEAVEQVKQFNDSLQAFRNIFIDYQASIQNIADVSKQITDSFQLSATVMSQISTALSGQILLPPTTKQPEEIKPSIIVELRAEMSELKDELSRFRSLIEASEKQPLLTSGSIEPVHYDKDSKTIFIKGSPVKIDTNARSGNQTDLCDLVFKNKSTIKNGIFNSEIFKFWGNYDADANYVRDNWKVIYQTVKRINEKVSNQTFAPEFLKCTTYKTRINKFYL